MWVRGYEEGERSVLLVEDDGPGFPGPVAEADPQPFYTTREHGTGLGLPIARGIVESHGGTLGLENRDEGGARVVITFDKGPR